LDSGHYGYGTTVGLYCRRGEEGTDTESTVDIENKGVEVYLQVVAKIKEKLK
jgi:hypothetical protein